MSYAIKFPRDEQTHDKIIEWWYWNGHLEGEDGNQYAFMDCLFQAKPKEVKLPFFKMPFNKAYFSHSIISDLKKQKAYPTVDYLSLISSDSFKRPLLFVDYVNADIFDGYTVSSMKEIEPFKYHLRAKNLDLILTATKKPLLENSTGYFNFGSRSTYYYSLTNLKTEGIIRINNQEIKVKGKSWMDHQWADVAYAKDEWNWFSIQLDNNVELVCFELEGDKNKSTYAGISYADGKSEYFREVIFTPIGKKWISVKTKAAYPLAWTIEIPEKKIKLQVEPLIKNQEIIFGTINYWEGPLAVSGVFAGKKVEGRGFLELVGRPSQYKTYNFFKENLSKTIKSLEKKVRDLRK
jgi:predicted secreted hydrolase